MADRNAIFNEKHPKIVVSRFGQPKAEERNYIIKVMKECYERLKPHKVELVDLCLFERSSAAEAFLLKEGAEVGVGSAYFGELFFATHEAWRGTPRITLCFERMRKLPRLVRIGGIRHEVGHSVLHGSLRYYLLSPPLALLNFAKSFDLSLKYTTNMLYLISIAVKDYEVSRLLHERGYLEDQVAYVKHLLTVSESDTLSWKLSRGNPQAKILCLISVLKAAGCAVPLIPDKTFGEEMRRHLADSLSYLPTEYSSVLFKTILKDFSSLGANTLNNIDQLTRSIVEKVVKPVLES